MRVSIKDIAKAAGVSHSTVSRALSDSSLVSSETRDRIRQIAQDLGYSPNAMARGLVTQQTRTIGVIVTTIADPFIGEVVRGIEEVAADNSYRVFLATSHSDPLREVNLVKGFREWRVDGVIVASSRVGALYIPLLNEIGVPVVLINSQQEGPYVHSVTVDNIQGAELATRHLLSLGHRTIGYMGGPADHSSHRDRLAGYRRALSDAGISFDPSLVLPGNGRADSGKNISNLLAHSPVATAVFCYNDLTAIGVVHALTRRALRVPGDLSVVGFDDIEFASYVDPPLTTIHQPKDEMGRLATRMLMDLLTGHEVANVKVPGELVVRESSREFAAMNLPVSLPA